MRSIKKPLSPNPLGTAFKWRQRDEHAIQAKLKINKPEDSHEVEAGQAAKSVVNNKSVGSPINFSATSGQEEVQTKAENVQLNESEIGPGMAENAGEEKAQAKTQDESVQAKEEEEVQGKEDGEDVQLKEEEVSEQSPIGAQVSESKAEQTEPTATEPNESIQQNSIEEENNKNENADAGTLLKTDTQEPVEASQQEEEMPAEQGSQTPEEASTSLVEPDTDPAKEQDPEAQESTEIGNEGTQQSDAEQESMAENVTAASEMIFHLDDLEKSHTESLSAYQKVTQKNIRTLTQQSEKALQTCDNTYHHQASLIESGYGNAIRKVKKALSTTLADLGTGKSNGRKKLTSILDNKVKKAGYITWNKQQQAEAMGGEFANKTWTYTTELKGDSDKKAYDQKQEIKANGADAKRKYKNHKYRTDVNEAVDESVLDYCETINESTADLKATLNEDAGGMATNFKNEARDLKALLPKGKQNVIQNIQAIARDGAKQFNKVDQDLLPTLRKQMHVAEEELQQARKQALISLKNAWMQSRQGIKEQQKQLELKLRDSEKQAVKENKQVMTEVRAEHSENPGMESQLGEMNALMKESPGELAAAQQNLLKQGGMERQKGVQLAQKGMTTLASGAVKQAQKMADTAVKGAAKLKAGALKGYGQVVNGNEKIMNDELSRYEQSLDKIIGDARSDWNKKLGEGKWGMRNKAHGVWYENGKLRKESRRELFAVAKDASEVDFWDVLQAIGYFLLGVLAVLALILVVLVVIWAIGALLGYLAGVLMAVIGETLLGALLASLGTLLEAGIVWLLQSTVFWVAASAYGVYSGAKTIINAKNNPHLTRNQAAYEYGFGTGEIVTSLLPAWFKFKSKIGTRNSEEYVNLASPGRTQHIIAGDATGGGHAWFGSLKSFVNGITLQKSMFPPTWSHEKIMHAISHVATNNGWVQQSGRVGALLTRSGRPVRFIVEGYYKGIKIKVVTTHTDIITAHPIK